MQERFESDKITHGSAYENVCKFEFDDYVSKGDFDEEQPCFEYFCENFFVQAFEETYEVLDEFCVDFLAEGNYVNEDKASVVPDLISEGNEACLVEDEIQSQSFVVPNLFYDDCLVKEAHNVPKIVDSPLKGENTYVDACLNKTHQGIVVVDIFLKKTNANVCDVRDKVALLKILYKGRNSMLEFLRRGRKMNMMKNVS